jgi:hypothetical protein
LRVVRVYAGVFSSQMEIRSEVFEKKIVSGAVANHTRNHPHLPQATRRQRP